LPNVIFSANRPEAPNSFRAFLFQACDYAGDTGCEKSNLFCHSERSEESLFYLRHEKKEEFLASLEMTTGVEPFFRSMDNPLDHQSYTEFGEDAGVIPCYNFLRSGTTTMQNAIVKDKDILGGEPVFRGTRVPFKILLEYLEGGDNLDEFLEQYPSVSRDMAVSALEEARLSLVSQLK
jgi:uncharacterized protein (DUF433 family)